MQKICRLCLVESEQLCESHFLPAFSLKRAAVDSVTGQYSHPVAHRKEIASQNANPLKARALCPDCEDLIKKRGEYYSSMVCYQEEGSFPLRELMQRTRTPKEEARFQLQGMKCEALAYFGLSVFWRADLWKEFYKDIILELPHGQNEQLCRWLLTPKGIPTNTEIWLTVVDSPCEQHDAEYGQMISAPYQVQNSEIFQARFLCVGLVYDLFVADSFSVGITEASLFKCMAHLGNQHETGIHKDILRSIETIKKSKNLLEKIKTTV